MALEWLRGKVDEARARAAAEVQKFKNREFMNSMIAAIAKTSFADGDVSSAEKQKLVRYFETSAEFKVFKTSDVIETFKSIIDKFEFDKEIGNAEALKIIGRMKGNEEAGRLIVRICCVIGGADGDFSAPEKEAVGDICRELGLDPAEFDL